jgi:tRNA U55 pseudouridine synthase TruB
MGRRSRRHADREERGASGFLVVDKPTGWTSHDVVDAARGWLSARRIGHLGTLDPNATGVLPLAVRSATKLIEHIQDRGKSYATRPVASCAAATVRGPTRRRCAACWPASWARSSRSPRCTAR